MNLCLNEAEQFVVADNIFSAVLQRVSMIYPRDLRWLLKLQNNIPEAASLQVCPDSPSTHAGHQCLSSPAPQIAAKQKHF